MKNLAVFSLLIVFIGSAFSQEMQDLYCGDKNCYEGNQIDFDLLSFNRHFLVTFLEFPCIL